MSMEANFEAACPESQDLDRSKDRRVKSKIMIYSAICGIVLILSFLAAVLYWTPSDSQLLQSAASASKAVTPGAIVDEKTGHESRRPSLTTTREIAVWLLPKRSTVLLVLLVLVVAILVSLISTLSLLYCCKCVSSEQEESPVDSFQKDVIQGDDEVVETEEPESVFTSKSLGLGFLVAVVVLGSLFLVGRKYWPKPTPPLNNTPNNSQTPSIDPERARKLQLIIDAEEPKDPAEQEDAVMATEDEAAPLFSLAAQVRQICAQIKNKYGDRMPKDLSALSTLGNALICLYAASENPDQLLFYSTQNEREINTDLDSEIPSAVKIAFKKGRVPREQVATIESVLVALKDHAQLCLDVLALAEKVRNSAEAFILLSSPSGPKKPLYLLRNCSPTNLVVLLDNDGNLDMDVDLRSYKKQTSIMSIFSENARQYGLVNLKRHYEKILKKLQQQTSPKKQQ